MPFFEDSERCCEILNYTLPNTKLSRQSGLKLGTWFSSPDYCWKSLVHTRTWFHYPSSDFYGDSLKIWNKNLCTVLALNPAKNVMPSCYGCGSTASRLEFTSSLLFTTKFPDIPGLGIQPLGIQRLYIWLGH